MRPNYTPEQIVQIKQTLGGRIYKKYPICEICNKIIFNRHRNCKYHKDCYSNFSIKYDKNLGRKILKSGRGNTIKQEKRNRENGLRQKMVINRAREIRDKEKVSWKEALLKSNEIQRAIQ